MNCLQDYIGIDFPGAPTPDSGLYLNQLPGVSLKGMDKVANEEQISFAGVWKDVQQRSLKKFSTSIINYFSKRYQLRRINESIKLPTIFLSDTNMQTAAAPGYRGFTFDLGYHASPLAKVHIETLSLYLLTPQTTVTFNVWEVVDDDNANLIDTLTLSNAVAGWNTLKVNRDYNVWKVFVGYEASAIDSVWLPLNQAYDLFNSTEYMAWPFYSPCEAWIRGAQSNSPYSNLQELNNLYGLSAEISTHCSFEPLICAQKALFATALWYQLGAELMTERIFSDRLNKYTTIDLKRAQDLQQYFQKTADTELAALLDGINLASWDCCIDCNEQVQLIHSLP